MNHKHYNTANEFGWKLRTQLSSILQNKKPIRIEFWDLIHLHSMELEELEDDIK